MNNNATNNDNKNRTARFASSSGLRPVKRRPRSAPPPRAALCIRRHGGGVGAGTKLQDPPPRRSSREIMATLTCQSCFGPASGRDHIQYPYGGYPRSPFEILVGQILAENIALSQPGAGCGGFRKADLSLRRGARRASAGTPQGAKAQKVQRKASGMSRRRCNHTTRSRC